jgi:tetratricopeptide (TPR) repeat protein
MLSRILELHPEHAAIWHLLGMINGQLGLTGEAERCCRRAIELQPDFTEAHSILGNVYLLQGKPAEAETCYREAIRINPDYADAYNNLGNLLKATNRIDEAGNCFREALRLNPRLAEAHFNLGNILSMHNDQVGAESCYRRAIEHNPDHAAALACLGDILRNRGDYRDAVLYFGKALRLQPHTSEVITAKAGAHVRLGEYQQAYDDIRPLLDAGIESTALALVLASLCKRFQLCDKAIAILHRTLEKEHDRGQKIQLYFELGRLYDAKDEYDQAFEHYRQGNMLVNRPYNHEHYVKLNDQNIRIFSREFLASAPRSSIDTHRPVFIVGMPRSGTTLVEQILASHPRVTGAGELMDIINLTSMLPGKIGTDNAYPLCITEMTRDTCNTLARHYIDKLATLSGNAELVTDKMPHNFLHLGLIAMLFPQAHIIHCTRHPLDTCLSCYFQFFFTGQHYSFDLNNLGHHYNEYRRIMEHWGRTLDIPIFDLSYEGLISDPEKSIREMLDYCGLEWDDQCLHFHETARLAHTASYENIRETIYTRSMGRWKNYKRHLGPLIDVVGSGD